MKAPKYFFFDLDNTLTRSTSSLAEEHKDVFERLVKTHEVVVVSGAKAEQIEKQMGPSRGRFGILSQNGNVAIVKTGEVFWNNQMPSDKKKLILAFIEKLKNELAIPVTDEHDLIEDRGAQISYSLIGHHEDKTKKEAFDPDKEKRKQMLKKHADEVAKLKTEGIEIGIGGTTTLDFMPLGKNKGFNIGEFIKRSGWNTDESVYFGDALFPGGNDDSVNGMVPTQSVKDYNETFAILEKLFP